MKMSATHPEHIFPLDPDFMTARKKRQVPISRLPIRETILESPIGALGEITYTCKTRQLSLASVILWNNLTLSTRRALVVRFLSHPPPFRLGP